MNNYTYPPDNLSPAHFHTLTTHIKDYQANHGSLIKVIGHETQHSVLLQPVGTSVFPTLFPRRLFQQAVDDLQPIYNDLYCKLAADPDWLYAVTGPLRSTQPLVDALWCVHEEVQRRRRSAPQLVQQKVHAGVFRSDYMLHTKPESENISDDDDDEDKTWTWNVSLKQVEFNSYSCAGGCHANKVANMHRYLARRGVYDFPSEDSQQDTSINASSLPPNDTINGIASLLASAHGTYGPKPYNSTASKTVVLMIVQPNNFNIADERPIEYALWNWDEHPIPTYRLEWQDVLRQTSLTPTGELLLHTDPNKKPLEVSVIYHRAGYEPHEYVHDAGKETRIRLELARAIKCPSVLGHITTIKKVQQTLTVPGVLERWLSPQQADVVRETFVNIYGLDQSKAQVGHELDISSGKYILKPVSLEGGGHNTYDPGKIQELITGLPPDSPLWDAYILMERINSPRNVYGVLMAPERGIVAEEVVSELGVFGGCLWMDTGEEKECRIIENRVVGWSFKTKEVGVDEMSVVKGYGCFDTPLLID
jgi:glutathione synthase